MLSLPQRKLLGYGFATFGVALALLITTQIDLLAGRTPLFFAAVILATWFGGRTCGIVAVAISAVTSFYFIVQPQYSFDKDLNGFVQTGTFMMVCLPISLLISALRSREVLLRASEGRYRFLFEYNPFPMWVFDTETLRFLAVNEAATRVYGYTTREFLSMTIKEIRPEHEVPALLNDISGTKKRSGPNNIWRHRKRDGTLFDAEVTAHDLTFDGRPARLVLAVDISERENAHSIRERLAAIVDSSDDAIISRDLEGIITSWNPAAAKMFGYTQDEMMGHRLMLIIPPERIAEESDMLDRMIGGDVVNHFETVRVAKDGRLIDVSVTVSPIRDHHGTITGASKIARDITERKATATKIRQLNESLEKRVSERTAELEAANRELEAFSYSVSHDLRAPLRHINGFSQALVEDCSEHLNDLGRNYLDQIRSASREMAQLIDDVLLLARVTRSEMHRERVDLSGIAADVLLDLQARDAGRRVMVTVEEELTGYGDKRLLAIAFTNLLENAWKFTSRRVDAKIVFGAMLSGETTTYFVRDNGAGFDMTYADKLYGAFQRLHGAEEFEGTGIGLATVQRIVKRHGGKVWAESEVDKGATFYFTLTDHKELQDEGQGDLARRGQPARRGINTAGVEK